ncbi:hypothetical protein [Streptomyces sp. NPDC093094]|uniref:hypothetical protein n=1 Tax=Streptomyces sp. NPDC093094 TaxID=3366026 RepID=UPI003821CA2D
MVRHLDGQDFGFDDGRRVSGTGTRAPTDDPGGQEIRLTMRTRTRAETRGAATAGAASTAAAGPPSAYTWHLCTGCDAQRRVELFFLYGDPGIGNRYVLRRPAEPDASAHPARKSVVQR